MEKKAVKKTTKKVAVMDRTKEPGAAGEPLYIDVRNSIGEAMEEGLAPFTSWPKVVGGRINIIMQTCFFKISEDKNPMVVDSAEPVDTEEVNFRTFAGNENRFKQLLRKNPEGAKVLFDKAQQNVKLKYALYKQIADIKL